MWVADVTLCGQQLGCYNGVNRNKNGKANEQF